jgi:hypothetical protein
LSVAAVCAFSQTAISARPGTINYVEGKAYIDGQLINQNQLGHVNLELNQTLSTDPNSKAELLLTPGVFFRLGSNSEVRMVGNSLTNTQVALTRGEALVDVDMLFKDNNVQILNGASSTKLLKNGLYRFDATSGQVAVYDGKAYVQSDDRHVELGKGHQVTLASAKFKSEKFNTKETDDLYAWSNLRSEYAAEASYATAKNINVYNYGGWGWGAGWLWNPWYSSWAFMPWGGYAYDPFGWAFFSPAYIGYAPIYYAPWRRAVVPVNPAHVPNGAALRSMGIRPGVAASLRPLRPAVGMHPMGTMRGGFAGGGHFGGGHFGGGRR